jgi:hypothetical protein
VSWKGFFDMRRDLPTTSTWPREDSYASQFVDEIATASGWRLNILASSKFKSVDVGGEVADKHGGVV